MEAKKYWRRIYLALAVIFISWSCKADAADTFEDSKGRFTIDLPSGWKLEPQTDETVFVFKGESNTIIIQYFADINDRGELFVRAVNQLKISGLPNASPVEQGKDLTVNSNPARSGLYSDEMAVGAIKVKLYAILGSVSLKKGGVYFMSIVNESTLKTMRNTLEMSYQSIRNPGQPLSGAGVATQVQPDNIASESMTFTHQLVTLDLPPGWISAAIPANFEKEVIGWLKSKTIPGANITVMCYSGLRYNYKSVRIGGLRTVAAAYPKGQKALKNPTKLRTANGYPAVYELWQGVSYAGTDSVLMQSPMVIVKTNSCWLMMIGYAGDQVGSQLEKDFTKIFQSVK
jgi:hypothetical protein